MTRSSRPIYPPYRSTDRAHVLAEDFDASDYEAWLCIALENRYDVMVESIVGWRFYVEALADTDRAVVHAASNASDTAPRIVSITWSAWLPTGPAKKDGTLRKVKHACSLFLRSSWPDGTTIEDIQATCGLLNVGTYATPASLGSAVMRRAVEGAHYTASLAVEESVRQGLVGGRAEMLFPGVYDELFEQDQSMSFTAACLNDLPGGAAIAWQGPDLPNSGLYYVRCVIYVRLCLPVGPFPVRDTTGKLHYPTAVGTYEDVWLTNMQVQDCIDAGCTIIVRDGWVWPRQGAYLAEWARTMYLARERAASKSIATCIKQVAVAAIGVHAMQPERLIVHRPEDFPDGEFVLQENRVLDCVVERRNDTYPTQMVVWALFIWAHAQSSLYHRQLAETLNGNTVIATNFDNVLTVYPSTLPIERGLGGWRENVLTHVEISHVRFVVSDQKTRRPGIPCVERTNDEKQTKRHNHVRRLLLGPDLA